MFSIILGLGYVWQHHNISWLTTWLTMADNTERFYYVYSCDLDANVSLKIGNLEGKREKRNYKALVEDPQLRFSGLYQSSCSDLYVSCQVYADGQPLCLPTRTAYRPFNTRWKTIEQPPKLNLELSFGTQSSYQEFQCDGPEDTSPASATRSTYLPSLLHFHEEIMLIHGIQPSVPKTKPSLRDRIIKQLEEKQPRTELTESVPEPGLFMKMYLRLQGFFGKMPFFRR